MAQLQSPGVSVTVIDESFYTSNAPGTVPLIFVTTAEGKSNSAGTGTALGTLKANAGQVYLLTSQKDLSDKFGMPVFQTDAQNNPINAGELNEYGLNAAYSVLGVINRAFVVRADVDLNSLMPSATLPYGEPANGTYWFDSADTLYGIFIWNSAPLSSSNGQKFSNYVPNVITNPDAIDVENAPLASSGQIGQLAIVAVSNLVRLWYKKAETDTAAGTWVEVGSAAWAASMPSARGTTSVSLSSGNAFTITVNGAAHTHPGCETLNQLVTAINQTNPVTGITAHVVNNALEIYSTGADFTLSGANAAGAGFTVGTPYKAPTLQISAHTQVPLFKRADGVSVNGMPTGSIWIKTTTPNLGARWSVNLYSSYTSSWVTLSTPMHNSNAAAILSLDPVGGGASISKGTLYVKYNDSESTPQYADFKLYVRSGQGETTIISDPIIPGTFTVGSNSFDISETYAGSANFTSPITITFTATGTTADADIILLQLTSSLASTNIIASKNSLNQIIISHSTGGDIKFSDGTNTPIDKLFVPGSSANFFVDPSDTSNSPTHYVASLWTAGVDGSGFAFNAPTAPTSSPADQTLWYNSVIEDVDIMINNGTAWVGYLQYAATSGTNPAGPFIGASAPTAGLQNNDLWIDDSDLENYPKIYRYSSVISNWILIDNTDHTTENGIIFADARWATAGDMSAPSSIVQLLNSDYLDPDAPSAALYPKGTLLWNLRRSGFNVKKYVKNYINRLTANHNYGDESMFNYFPDRWVSDAANNISTHVGTFGRKAQRAVVIQAIEALIANNQQIRDEDSRVFNLIACPGYPEVLSSMKGLNYDRGLTAFIVGDSPARLTPDATSLNNWAANVNNAIVTSEAGLVDTDPYMAVFYPWGLTTDSLGNYAVVPPSHMMLRTIALSDNVSYPWFAPAGTRRGIITNAGSVGYINSQGEYLSVALNTGQRDTLSINHVNPITYITGTGLVNFGQYTRQLTSTALDRINVARLVVYLRRQLDQIAKSYLFEPNDTITRNEIKGQIESFLLELMGQRALYDFIVVCDTTNNTPTTIDASELHVDIAIEPVKAVEFIYIPLRIKNTGSIKNLATK